VHISNGSYRNAQAVMIELLNTIPLPLIFKCISIEINLTLYFYFFFYKILTSVYFAMRDKQTIFLAKNSYL